MPTEKARPKKKSAAKKKQAANLGFEAKLWLAAGKLRSNMDAAGYKTDNAEGAINAQIIVAVDNDEGGEPSSKK